MEEELSNEELEYNKSQGDLEGEEEFEEGIEELELD